MENMTNSVNVATEDAIREGLKVISYLLQYPEKKWLQVPELMEETHTLSHPWLKEQLAQFLTAIGDMTFLALQEHYVNTFDFYEACTLYLSYLKIGEKRERGAFLIELKTLYQDYGFALTDEELPDSLPVVLEFASVAPFPIATNLLNSFQEMIGKLGEALHALPSPYGILVACCVRLIEEMNLIREGQQ